MSIPCNATDFERFIKLANALAKIQPPVEVNIYIGMHPKTPTEDYVSLEIKGNLPNKIVEDVFGIPSKAENDVSIDAPM